jgi:hypothetical protein
LLVGFWQSTNSHDAVIFQKTSEIRAYFPEVEKLAQFQRILMCKQPQGDGIPKRKHKNGLISCDAKTLSQLAHISFL